jgi:hypothetical protein
MRERKPYIEALVLVAAIAFRPHCGWRPHPERGPPRHVTMILTQREPRSRLGCLRDSRQLGASDQNWQLL